MSRLSTLMSNDRANLCKSLVSDYGSEGEGFFKSLNPVIPCSRCDTCRLKVPYVDLKEVLDE